MYELEGFREILSKDVVEKLKKGDPLSEGTEIEFPDKYLLVAKRGYERYPFEEMILSDVERQKGGLVLIFKSITQGVELEIFLDFMNEKLGFDPIYGFRIHKDRSNQQRVKEELSALQFQKSILSNGHLEIWDVISEKRLGCSDSYIPVNCSINSEHFSKEFEILEAILAEEGKFTGTTADA